MHHILKNRVLPVAAGAVIVVGGLNVASYAGNGHHSAPAHRPAAHTAGFGHSGAATQSMRAKKHPVSAYTFTVPRNTALPFEFQLKNLPKGRYAASFNVATTSATGPVVPFCSVADSTSPFSVVSYGVDHGDPTDDIAINSASGIVKLAKKGQLAFGCSDADQTYNEAGSKNVLVLTPLHRVVRFKGKPVPPIMRNAKAGFGH